MPLVQAKQQPLEIGLLEKDLQTPLPDPLECVAPRLLILLDPVRIQQYQPMLELPTPRMSPQTVPSRVDNIYGVATTSRLHVEMKVKTLLVATASEELDKRPVALSFDPNEDGSPARYPRSAAHGALADSRETAQHAGSVLGVQARVAAEPPDILGAVHPSSPCIILFDDEDLFLFEFVEETDVM